MPNDQIPSPENQLSQRDPGDETSNRYRFQWTWAAIVSCGLLDKSTDTKEVFCEHHEDVLYKHHNGKFTGYQVKTRDENQPPWKAGDEAVLASCARFAEHESRFPQQFRRFGFLTNHQLFAGKNGQDLTHVLKLIKETAVIDDLPSIAAKWIKRVTKLAQVTEAVTFTAMSKTIAKADLPKLRDAEMRLIDAIVQCWPPAEECSHGSVKRAAQELIDKCGRASSLAHLQVLPAYLIATGDDYTNLKANIDGKRMTVERLQDVLERGRDSKATMEGRPDKFVTPGEGSTDLMQQKLDAGGFSAVSRNAAEDLRDKADYLGVKWTKQFGNTKGLGRYDHVRSIALSDAGRSFDATQNDADRFGPKMREDLRRLFQDRRKAGEELFDTTDDHLEGIAFSLTSQCKIAWSHARPWEADDESS